MRIHHLIPIAMSLIAGGAQAQWTVTILRHPGGAPGSVAHAASGNLQIGSASAGGVSHAGMWAGTTASWVDLHPAGLDSSAAFGASATHQVGYASLGDDPVASLWSGTAASWVNLNPS